MKLKRIGVLTILFLAAPVFAGAPPELKTQKEKVSYGIGVDAARNFMQLGIDFIDFDADILVKGLRDTLSGRALS